MDSPARRRRWRIRSIALGALLVVALLASLALAPGQASTRIGATLRALSGWLWSTRWAWPLAAALALAALITPPARRRWPQPARRILPAIAIFVVLVGLTSLTTVSRPRVAVLTLGAIVAVGLLATWVVVVPRRLAPPLPAETLGPLGDRDRLEVADARTKLQNDLRTTALQAIAGLAVLAGAILAFQQLTEDRQQAASTRELTLQGQASERFTRAIDQLGSERREVQLGGIYGLEQIAQQAPANRLAVTEVLVAYLRRRMPRPPTRPPDPDILKIDEFRLSLRAPDAQAALTVLGRRQIAETDPPLDLRALDLRGADLSGVDLRGMDLREADLRGAGLIRAGLSRAKLFSADLSYAELQGADLRGAVLSLTNLRRADLRDADLRGADLRAANLNRAILIGVDLRGRDLRGADLRGTVLSGADLSGMDLGLANLSGTDLRGADLRGTDLSGTNLRGADLSDADLRDAVLGLTNLRGAVLRGVDLRDAVLSGDLRGADLRGVDFSGVDLHGAFADQGTKWPNGFDWKGAGVLSI